MERVGICRYTIVTKQQHKGRMRRRLRFGRWCLFFLLAGHFAAGANPAGAERTGSAPKAPIASQSTKSPVQLDRMLLLLAPSAAQAIPAIASG
jgi:hypothetical protein